MPDDARLLAMFDAARSSVLILCAASSEPREPPMVAFSLASPDAGV
jgi:hypothetical protein